ncbi:uncharacterized protein [Dendrobates tinctorius]|uniref:uncharacterized protein n=1 Tax=Dendrobates tinctorius TaxID=92724 RepID=UPI003CC9CBC6
MTMMEKEALEALISLEEENEMSSEVSMIPTHPFVKSKTFPSLGLCPVVDIFTKLVSQDIESLAKEHDSGSNFTRLEREAIEEMKLWRDVVFKPSDKGGNIVIWPTAQYEAQAIKLLDDPECYCRLSFNPLSSFQTLLVNILDKAFMQGIISKKLLDQIRNNKPKLPALYLIPKIHKNPTDPPGRPIVSGNNGPCELIGHIIDHFLKPLVAELPSYIRDTTSALQRLDQLCLDDNTLIVTADVESMHTLIRHSDGLSAVQFFLQTSSLDISVIELIMILLEFLLTHNGFIFNGKHYLQKQGTAMGASCAPSYANLFLGAWEREIFQGGLIQEMDHVHNWMRYIDDVLFFWDGPLDGLKNLFHHLNNNNKNIKLSFQYGRERDFFFGYKIKNRSRWSTKYGHFSKDQGH